ncbi:methionine ABC transporter ATP-binding protein [Pseudothauera rhizosphaerae]|uniref:Cell division ATP-binding protein FtsE n=1 Tax=Pseudothauera rhizosphaerae TaxID=2565932 RepID=A0A4S4AZ27_9RHOO|nr:methionine ABC transporter ATP-binding protein [Pseudothauera rhizosphaerae]
MFRLQGVGKTFPGKHGTVTALDGIDLDIREGEVFGVIGRSGAGKSTLLRVLNLLERPSAGSVLLDGEELTALPAPALRAVRRRIGMIFQHFNLLASRTVADNIALPLELAGVPRARVSARVDELLELVGLTAQRDRYPAQISGGQKQRVGIARALANEPRVLLCDEATSALDPETTQSILELLADINRRLNLTIVLITHQMQVIKAVAHRVAVLEDGRIVEAGDVADVFTAPRETLTRTLLREVIGDDIPPGVHERVAALARGWGSRGALWRLSLRGEAVDAPLLAELSSLFSVRAHLLHGYIDEVRGVPFGSLVAALHGSEADLADAAAWLTTRGVRIEEIAA